MPMLQTKYSLTKQYDVPLFLEPQSTQEIFSIKDIDETGIFALNNGKYSKTFILSDINFAGVTDEEQKTIIINYSRVLNAMPYRFSIAVANEYVDENAFNNRIMYRLHNDKKDGLREDFNSVINNKVTSAKQGLYQNIYVTVTIPADDIKEARTTFSSLEATLRSAFIQIGTNGMAGATITAMDINERMQKWHNFTHAGLNSTYKFDFMKNMRLHKDWINDMAPSHIEFFNDYFIMNHVKYGRVLYMENFPKNLESELIAELAGINCTNYVVQNSEILDIQAFKKEINRKYASVGLKIEGEKKRNRDNNDYLADASNILLGEKEQLDRLLNQVSDGDDHYFNTTVLILFVTDSMEQLKEVTDKIATIASMKSADFSSCFDKQREALNSAFIFGVQEFKRCCNLSAPCHAMFVPFKTQELNDEDGNFYGINQLSQNAIIANRKKLTPPHGVVLGKSRSGKSVFSKLELISTNLNNEEDQIIVIDPMGEYSEVANAPGIEATIVSFDSKLNVFVNPLDVNFDGIDYATLQEIISEKTDFILTLLSSCMKRDLNAEEIGVLDRVCTQVYSENYAMRKRLNGEGSEITEYSVPAYMKSKEVPLPVITQYSPAEQMRMYSPMLQDIYQKLVDQTENSCAQNLSAHMQVFVDGSLNFFNHRTNVDLDKNFLVFNLLGIKSNLLIPTMLVMLEMVNNRIRKNFLNDLWTFTYIDEFHELLAIPAVMDFVFKMWKEVGKHKGIMTGITQNMTDMLNKSADADKLAALLSNSEYFVMLNQSTIDRRLLADFLPSISPAMFNYVEGAAQGTGLLKMGNITVPFDMRMSKSSRLYKLVNTSNDAEETAV